MTIQEPMKCSKMDAQEGGDRSLIEAINQINYVSLGEGAATCQVCGSSFHEGDAVVAYVFRAAGEVVFQVGYAVCGDDKHEPPKPFTLGVRELLVECRVGWCLNAATRSSRPVLLGSEVVAVSEASAKSVREVQRGDRGSVDGTKSAESGEERRSSTKMSAWEWRRCVERKVNEVAHGENWRCGKR